MKIFIQLLVCILLAACGGQQPKLSVVGTRNGDLITVKPHEVKDTVDLYLSDLVEDIEIIRLDTSKDALVKPAPVYVSENYLVTGLSKEMKLFDRKTGRFIGNVGNLGRGPGEYLGGTYCAQIDEKIGNIYLLNLVSNITKNEILVYDMTGKWRGKNIPLASYAPKGVFKIDSQNNKVQIAALPFENECEYVAWEQDLDGNMINGVKARHLDVIPDFSHEVTWTRNSSSLNFQVVNLINTVDTLYHYDGGNKITPVFNIDYGSKKLYDFYYELPTMFICGVGGNEIFVNKKTLQGAWCRLRNDFLGGYVFGAAYCAGGYYAHSIEPMLLFERIEPMREKATGKVRQRIDYILNNVGQYDNNVVVIGKLKE